MRDRSLLYETLEALRREEITSKVEQGSIQRLNLWNASYDSLVNIRLNMPDNLRLVGYADDIAALVARQTVKQAQSRHGILLLMAHGFSLALVKKEIIILTRKTIPTLRPISFSELAAA